ncbi:MAG TPA: hypothetical protein VEC12_14265 [Bacteroidia bacterium]|nr:hypothetical protein [Bacteroidia bacterium]
MKEVRTAFSLEEAEDIKNLLEESNIDIDLKEHVQGFDTIYSTNPAVKTYKIFVADNEAETAMNLLNYHYDGFDADTILVEYDTPDLIEIITYPETHGQVKVVKAQNILLNRGLADIEIQARIANKLTLDNTSARADGYVVLAGYLLALATGLLGFFIGWFLFLSKARHTKTGEKYFAHDKNTRNHGFYIMAISIITFISILILVSKK